MRRLNIAVTSAGRRLYLVAWFREALKELGVVGEVIVADSDPQAPALTAGDRAAILPSFTDPDYEAALLELCRVNHVGLLVTLNDYEAMRIAGSLADALERAGTVVPVLRRAAAKAAADKWVMTQQLGALRALMPRTFLGSDAVTRSIVLNATDKIVIKHRFGSASSGLAFGQGSDLRDLVVASTHTAPDETGTVQGHHARTDLVIVQERIVGQEYGVDVVADLQGTFVTAMARRKLRMRAGETDRAVTVSSGPFLDIAAQVNAAVGSRGLVDTDVVVDKEGTPYLIDVNPRFGGGYPFSHVAGANVPACYVAWASGLPIDERWLQPTVGVAGAKFESITAVR